MGLSAIFDGRFKGLTREFRPHLIAEDEPGICHLPRKEVRESLLAAGADHQLRVVHLRRVKERPEIILGGAGRSPCSLENLASTTVVNWDTEGNQIVSGR